MPVPPINTAHAARRTIRFISSAQALADAATLAAADSAGTLSQTGNWSLGQALNHVAAWMTFALDGYPVAAPPELAARARAARTRAFGQGLMAGFSIPGVPGGTAASAPCATACALAALQSAWARFERETPCHPHPFFGDLTPDEWLALQLRHSELHQSFFFPGASPTSPHA
ncbi:hypothetical protein BH11PLA1_BH11PLA1_08540 [soil metagenome]